MATSAEDHMFMMTIMGLFKTVYEKKLHITPHNVMFLYNRVTTYTDNFKCQSCSNNVHGICFGGIVYDYERINEVKLKYCINCVNDTILNETYNLAEELIPFIEKTRITPADVFSSRSLTFTPFLRNQIKNACKVCGGDDDTFYLLDGESDQSCLIFNILSDIGMCYGCFDKFNAEKGCVDLTEHNKAIDDLVKMGNTQDETLSMLINTIRGSLIPGYTFPEGSPEEIIETLNQIYPMIRTNLTTYTDADVKPLPCCYNCGMKNKYSLAKFCQYCGVKRIGADYIKKHCHRCSTPYEPDSQSCGECGYKKDSIHQSGGYYKYMKYKSKYLNR
jgi:hypothetical protein